MRLFRVGATVVTSGKVPPDIDVATNVRVAGMYCSQFGSRFPLRHSENTYREGSCSIARQKRNCVAVIYNFRQWYREQNEPSV